MKLLACLAVFAVLVAMASGSLPACRNQLQGRCPYSLPPNQCGGGGVGGYCPQGQQCCTNGCYNECQTPQVPYVG